MRGLFVTGTDTGAGKTLVSCAILAALGRRGLRVAAYKPVETGCRSEGGRLVGEDCERLAAVTGQDAVDVAACLFAEPAAPLVAARAEGRSIARNVLLERFHAISRDADFVLVESAGGLMVPVADDYTTRDLARELGLPVLVVVASRLGCINHALLTIEVLRSSSIPVAGFVMNDVGIADGYVLARRTNHDVLRRFAGVPDLGAMPTVEPGSRSDAAHLASTAEESLALDRLAAP